MTFHALIDAILADLFPGGFWYIEAPDSASSNADTYAVWLIVGGPSYQDLEGDIEISRPRIQVSVYSMDSADLVSKVAAVNAAMKAASSAGILKNYSASVPTDGREPDTRRFYSHMDFNCWNNQQ